MSVVSDLISHFSNLQALLRDLSYLVLMITVGLLVYVGIADFRTYRIRNKTVLLLGALAILYAFLSGRWVWLHWDFAFAGAMFAILLIAYSRGALGGGDVKLLTVSFLWTGIDCALVFAIGLLVFSLIHIIAGKLRIIGLPQENGRTRMAYAPSISASLIVVFLSGCLAPMR